MTEKIQIQLELGKNKIIELKKRFEAVGLDLKKDSGNVLRIGLIQNKSKRKAEALKMAMAKKPFIFSGK